LDVARRETAVAFGATGQAGSGVIAAGGVAASLAPAATAQVAALPNAVSETGGRDQAETVPAPKKQRQAGRARGVKESTNSTPVEQKRNAKASAKKEKAKASVRKKEERSSALAQRERKVRSASKTPANKIEKRAEKKTAPAIVKRRMVVIERKRATIASLFFRGGSRVSSEHARGD
jgi:hypothetical protein